MLGVWSAGHKLGRIPAIATLLAGNRADELGERSRDCLRDWDEVLVCCEVKIRVLCKHFRKSGFHCIGRGAGRGIELSVITLGSPLISSRMQWQITEIRADASSGSVDVARAVSAAR